MSLVNAGKAGVWFDSGKGKIAVTNAPIRGMEPRLLTLIETMVDALGFSLVILSVDTGQHVVGSRHYEGRAADITDIHVYGRDPDPVSVTNPHAVAMVQWLVNHGFTAGHENGPYDAVLLGPCGTRWNATSIAHEHHAHVSVKREQP